MSTFKEQPYLRLGVAGAASLLVLALLARIIYIVFSVGTNNPSNDDIAIVRFLGKYWAGNYQWENFARDTFDGGHAIMLPTLVYVADSHLTGLDIYSLLALGLLLAAAKLVLFHNAIVRSAPHADWYGPWLLLVILSALIFSVSHISVFEFNFTSVVNGLYKLGYALVIWGLVRFPRRWRGVWIALAGAMLSTVSSGVLAWPIVLIGMVLLGFRKPLQYAAVFVGAFIVGLPYFFYLRHQAFAQGNLSPFNAKIVLNILGRPFTNGTGSNFGDIWLGIWTAFGGLILVAIGLLLAWRLCRREVLRHFAPALMLLSFGLLFCWQVSFVRVSIAPWYSANAMDFWIGLVALAYLVWAFRKNPQPISKGAPERTRRIPLTLIAATTWPPLILLVVVLLLVFSNRTYSDKSFFMWTRAPVSVACLQQYKIAPTYCGPMVHRFAGVPGVLDDMAKPLQANGLSVFGSQQLRTLQGDSILPTVSYSDVPDVPETRWSTDLSSNGVPITDYRPLNLLLYPSNSVNWTVSLPPNMKEGRFHSAVELSSSTPTLSGGDRLQFLISAITDGQEHALFSRYLTANETEGHPVSIDLSGYAGKTITLRFRSEMDGSSTSGAWAVFTHPYIQVRFDGTSGLEQPITGGPSNTERSPFQINTGPDDFLFDIEDQSLWDVSGLTRKPPDTESAPGWIVAYSRPAMRYKSALNLPMAEYSHFFVRLSATVDLQPRSFALTYILRDSKGTLEPHNVIVPLLPDAKMHSYTFDLRLNGPKSGYELVDLGLVPAYGYGGTGPTIHIAEVRLIHRKAVPGNSP